MNSVILMEEIAPTFGGKLRMYWMCSHGQPALDGPLARGLGEGLMTTYCKNSAYYKTLQ